MYTLIAAMTKNRVIGLDNGMPWKQKNDLQHFKALTYGKKIVMGRKTYESFGSKPLPNRLNMVMTKKTGFELQDLNFEKHPNLAFRNSDSLEFFKGTDEEVFIIGGAQIYNVAMPMADKMYITELDCEIEGDAFFPEIDMNVWKIVSTETYAKDEFNQYDYKYLTYVRK